MGNAQGIHTQGIHTHIHWAYVHRAYIHTQGIHTNCICRKSTNSPFLCILSKDDYKQCRLFGLHHYHSNHWHYLSYCFAFFCFFSESSMSNKLHSNTLAFFLAFLASASSCSCFSTAGVLMTSPVFAWIRFLYFFVFPRADLVSSDCGGAIASLRTSWRYV